MTGRPPKQRTDYPIALVEANRSRLSADHFAVLMAATACNGNVEAIADALSMVSLGTVKSRLHRARKALAALLNEDSPQARAAESTVLGSG